MNVVLWWHFHQPDYREPGGTQAHFPWVRMHAFRAYTDLIALALDEDLRGMTINVVPSLADQLEDLAHGRVVDRHLRLAQQLAHGDDSVAALAFYAHAVPTPRPVIPLPRFDELRAKARARAFARTADAVDACALFQLAWAGFTAAREPVVKALLEKGADFTRDELQALLDLNRAYAGQVLPRLKTARAQGVVHLSTTPYAHPILPLLVDTQCAKEATHDGGAPPPFSSIDDAHRHVALALTRHQVLFGEVPRAMWPAEGALSEAALDVIASHGIKVVASDEELLRKSLEKDDRQAHLCAWTHPRTGLGLLFRDRALSDDWGFVYRDLPADAAAQSFVDGCVARRDKGSLVPVILDGENPFERFPFAGFDHLRALARAVRGKLRFLSPEEAVQVSPRRLGRLATGSWIHASLDIWAGDDEDRRAWDTLARVRRAIDLEALEGEAQQRALRHLLAAEGSDWFWWFGPEFRIPDKPGFDALFRRHLEEALTAAGAPAAPDLPRLDEPIAHASVMAPRAVPPLGMLWSLAPGGPLSSWHDAKKLPPDPDQGSMHRGAPLVEDLRALVAPTGAAVRLAVRDDVTDVELLDVSGGKPEVVGRATRTGKRALTLQTFVPFSRGRLELVALARAGDTKERAPREGALVVERPPRAFFEA